MKLIKKQTLKKVADNSTGLLAYRKLIFFLFLLTVGILTVKVYFSNQLAISGAAVNYSERKAQALASENHKLENQISSKSTLVYLENKAKEMGLVKVTKLESLQSLSPVAIKQ
jgi:hypothetical protein